MLHEMHLSIESDRAEHKTVEMNKQVHTENFPS